MSFEPLKVIRKFLDENGYEANFDVKKLAQELTYARNRDWKHDNDIWVKDWDKRAAGHKAELEKLRQESREQMLDVLISIVEGLINKELEFMRRAAKKAIEVLRDKRE